MILACPECTTRYLVAAKSLVKADGSGRNVKCRKCNHVWYQEPSLEALEAEKELAAEQETVPPPDIDDVPDFIKKKQVPAKVKSAKTGKWKLLSKSWKTFVIVFVIWVILMLLILLSPTVLAKVWPGFQYVF